MLNRNHLIAVVFWLISVIIYKTLRYFDIADYRSSIVLPIILILILKILKIKDEIVNLYVNYVIITSVIATLIYSLYELKLIE